MAAICVPPKVVDKFKQAFLSGDITPQKLMDMSSDERHQLFEKMSDKESGTTINSLLESKLLLKNQQKGLSTWAKTVTGLSQPAKRDIVQRINQLDRVLNPDEQDDFLKDLAKTKLGVGVTRQEAQKIAAYSSTVQDALEKKNADGSWTNNTDRLNYGRAVVNMTNYVNDLKRTADKFDFKDFASNPLGNSAKAADRLAGEAKAINASLDNSAIFRQGWKTLFTHPGIWQKNARQSFTNLVKQFGGKDVMDEVNADIISRPTYDKMVKAKLAVGNLEEAFPTTAPEKIPFLGRAYKASEAAYTAFVQQSRADIFDKYLQVAERSGVNTKDSKELESIGKLVNSLTGRGSLGRLEPVANTVNNVFFSPRFLKSNVDLLTQPLGAGGAKTAFARKQAAVNLLKVVTGTAAVMTVANAVRPGSVELDPRSSDFGKIKVGDTRFDITGGIGSIMTLASRVATQSSKSSTTGQVSKLNSGKFGSETSLDVVDNFFQNKLSPVGSVVRDLLKGQDMNGNKPTLLGEASNAFSPMGVQNFNQLRSDPNSANTLVAMIADGLGISASNYSPSGSTGLASSTGKEVTQFKQSIGADQFKQAAQDYNQKLNDWQNSIVKNNQYKNLSTSDQKEVVTKEKAKIQAEVFNQYNFKYQRATPQKDKFGSLL